MKLVSIPKDKYEKYRLDLMFEGYKWDPEWLDNITVGRHVLVLTEDEAKELEALAEKLHAETVTSEIALRDDMKTIRRLALPFSMHTAARRLKSCDADKHIRLMRFDFHPVKGGGYAVSEVNSDVPGGLADATLSTVMSAALFDGQYYRYRDFGRIMAEAIAKKTKPGGRVAMVHCTSYSDDRQVMQFMGDLLLELGLTPVYCAADHLKFVDNKAYCVLDGHEGTIDAFMRFTPLEWLPGIPRGWRGYFDCVTPSCNHPISLFWQTKACPFAWDALEKRGVDLSAWRRLLPETLRPRDLRKKAENASSYIFKPSFGRTGEGITIRAAMKESEYKKTMKDVRRHPRHYVAQKMFESQPLVSEEGEPFHVCLGVYSVEGSAAGFYARVSKYARIDSSSIEVPVLVESPFKKEHRTLPGSRFPYGRKIYEIWAPPAARWTNWSRPVPFIYLQEHEENHQLLELTTPPVYYFKEPPENTAIVLDLPGNDAVEEGLTLASKGMRPVVLYNGVRAESGATELVPTHAIEDALILGAKLLKSIPLAPDAPPVFLLDSNRSFKKRSLGVYDNGWDILPQDLPTAEYFRAHDIKNIIIHSDKLRKDLSAVLYNFQKGGIKILFTDGFCDPKETLLKKPKKQ